MAGTPRRQQNHIIKKKEGPSSPFFIKTLSWVPLGSIKILFAPSEDRDSPKYSTLSFHYPHQTSCPEGLSVSSKCSLPISWVSDYHIQIYVVPSIQPWVLLTLPQQVLPALSLDVVPCYNPVFVQLYFVMMSFLKWACCFPPPLMEGKLGFSDPPCFSSFHRCHSSSSSSLWYIPCFPSTCEMPSLPASSHLHLIR